MYSNQKHPSDVFLSGTLLLPRTSFDCLFETALSVKREKSILRSCKRYGFWSVLVGIHHVTHLTAKGSVTADTNNTLPVK